MNKLDPALQTMLDEISKWKEEALAATADPNEVEKIKEEAKNRTTNAFLTYSVSDALSKLRPELDEAKADAAEAKTKASDAEVATGELKEKVDEVQTDFKSLRAGISKDFESIDKEIKETAKKSATPGWLKALAVLALLVGIGAFIDARLNPSGMTDEEVAAAIDKKVQEVLVDYAKKDSVLNSDEITGIVTTAVTGQLKNYVTTTDLNSREYLKRPDLFTTNDKGETVLADDIAAAVDLQIKEACEKKAAERRKLAPLWEKGLQKKVDDAVAKALADAKVDVTVKPDPQQPSLATKNLEIEVCPRGGKCEKAKLNRGSLGETF